MPSLGEGWIGFDRPSYEYRAGETVTVLGRRFAPQTRVTITLAPPSAPSSTVGSGVLTDNSGDFQDSFTLAASAAPGAYVVVVAVISSDANGVRTVYEGREVFKVLDPPATVALPAPARPVPLIPAVGSGLLDFKTSLALTARVKRDERRWFTYRFSGRVGIPPGVSEPAVCGGTVQLRLKRGRQVVAEGAASVAKDCTYTKDFEVRDARRSGAHGGQLKVDARFGGNARLKSSTKSMLVRTSAD